MTARWLYRHGPVGTAAGQFIGYSIWGRPLPLTMALVHASVWRHNVVLLVTGGLDADAIPEQCQGHRLPSSVGYTSPIEYEQLSRGTPRPPRSPTWPNTVHHSVVTCE